MDGTRIGIRDRRGGASAAACGAVVVAALAAWGGPAPARAIETAALLDSLQHGAFDFFWNEANPSNGLVKDRSTPGSPCSIASTGFGLSAICIGIDHGWVSREDGRARVLTTLDTFWTGPQGPAASGTIGYQGLFYHFLDMNTATRTWSCELSTIDTALLFAGILDAKQYFDTADPLDVQVRALADSITHRANWSFAYNGIGIRMGWTPEGTSFGTWVGYNEATILYILAIGSPTHPVPSFSWFTWTSGYNWSTQYGQTYVTFPPLFGHQYSHCWIDFRSIQDVYMANKGITYFENSRRATLAQQAYCIANPGGWLGYGPEVWGLTASDDPFGYGAHGAPPPQNDNGTITPTAAASSIAFAPEIVIPTLHRFWDDYQAGLWGPYGFKDAFNLTAGWWATDYLGIDQGPILLMIENWRTGAVWSRFMQDPDVQNGLALTGFGPATSAGRPAAAPAAALRLAQSVPNPFRGSAVVTYRLPAAGPASLVLYDVRGRAVRTLAEGFQAPGDHQATLHGEGLPAGVYYYRLRTEAGTESRSCTLLK